MNLDPALIEELKQLDASMNAPKIEPEYRFYYDQHGNIKFCAEVAPYPDGNDYVVVNKTVYKDYVNYRIVDKQVCRIVKEIGQITSSLIKSTAGFRVVKNNAALILDEHEQFEKIEFYDTRTS